jgi:hypothetical protein
MTNPTSALVSQNAFSTTLINPVTSTDTTIYLNSLPTASEGYLTIDEGLSTQEVLFYNSKGANFVTVPSLADRALQGTTTPSPVPTHLSGAVVKMKTVAQYLQALANGYGLATNSITADKLATTSINLASVASSTSQTGVTSSDVIVTGLTSTVTIPAGGRRVRVEVLIPDMGSTAIAQWGLSIYNSATVTGSAVQKQLFLQAAAGTRISGYTFFEHTPSAGSQSYCAAISVDTGTGTTVLTSAKLAYLTVRLV